MNSQVEREDQDHDHDHDLDHRAGLSMYLVVGPGSLRSGMTTKRTLAIIIDIANTENEIIAEIVTSRGDMEMKKTLSVEDIDIDVTDREAEVVSDTHL